ncbi:MAG TPA: RsmD family RNA methyltransferase, partial [Pyrinomonadaceae bacterium]|nr:RsmD family RNA methyltransferase [Pyrinomonadaceae bacterium]
PAPARSRSQSGPDNRGPRSNGPAKRAGSGAETRQFGTPYGKPRRPGDGRPNRTNQNNGRFDPKKNRGDKRLHKPTRSEEPLIKITSDSQITDGKFRGHLLKNSVSPRMSHTDRRLREIMFKIVARRLKGRRFLDLGSGCGMIGIEAISRGAMNGTFVERSSKMCSFVRKNLEELAVKAGHGDVVEIEISPFLKRAGKSKRVWDLVYLGTRAADDEAVFDFLRRGTSVSKGGLLIIEHKADSEFPEKLGTLDRWRVIANGNASLTLYERK